MEASAAEFTVSVVDPVVDPEVALITVEPTPTPLASPALLIDAVDGIDELQVTELVRSCVLPSLYVANALNCWVWPFAIDGEAGVTLIDCRVRAAAPTVSTVEPAMVLYLALMVVDPDAIADTTPPAATVATARFEDVQVTYLLMSWEVPFVKVPIAVNCCCVPDSIVELAGFTAIEDSPVRVPVPLSFAVWGLVLALSTMERVPTREPSARGVKFTETVHFAPAAKVAGAKGQLVVTPKSARELVIELMLSAVGRLLVNVALTAALVVFTN
jgi:hypothetical protein